MGPRAPNTISALYEAICANPIVAGRRAGPPQARSDPPGGSRAVFGGRGVVVKHVKKSVLLWYSPREMYALVADVKTYPEYLPWCASADVLEERDDGITARLHLSYLGVRQAFTTRNTHSADESVVLELVDGPFSALAGTWRFVPVPMSDGPLAAACKIEFELRYAFAGGALEALISPVFDRIANTFVDSFVKRAEQVHGPR